MRNAQDRRHPATRIPPAIEDDRPNAAATERRHSPDRRIENLTLEERQLLFSEMPSLPPKSPSDK